SVFILAIWTHVLLLTAGCGRDSPLDYLLPAAVRRVSVFLCRTRRLQRGYGLAVQYPRRRQLILGLKGRHGAPRARTEDAVLRHSLSADLRQAALRPGHQLRNRSTASKSRLSKPRPNSRNAWRTPQKSEPPAKPGAG